MNNPVMNYNQFMAAFKKAAAGYGGHADINANDNTGTSKIKQELASVDGKGTAALDKYTKEYLNTVKKKSIVKK